MSVLSTLWYTRGQLKDRSRPGRFQCRTEKTIPLHHAEVRVSCNLHNRQHLTRRRSYSEAQRQHVRRVTRRYLQRVSQANKAPFQRASYQQRRQHFQPARCSINAKQSICLHSRGHKDTSTVTNGVPCTHNTVTCNTRPRRRDIKKWHATRLPQLQPLSKRQTVFHRTPRQSVYKDKHAPRLLHSKRRPRRCRRPTRVYDRPATQRPALSKFLQARRQRRARQYGHGPQQQKHAGPFKQCTTHQRKTALQRLRRRAPRHTWLRGQKTMRVRSQQRHENQFR